MIQNYRKKPEIIKAVQWTGSNMDEIRSLAQETISEIIMEYNNVDAEMLTVYPDPHLRGNNFPVLTGDYIYLDAANRAHVIKESDLNAFYELTST